MNVRRLEIEDHDLLVKLAGYAAGLEVPAPPYMERGDWSADLLGPIPERDRTRPLAFRFQIIDWKQPEWMPDDATIASVNYFPEGGAGLGWHTDSSRAGWRVYVTRLLSDLPGEFHHAAGWITDRPRAALAFFVDGHPCSSWHAVRALGPRFSVGLRFGPGATARALGLL